MKNPYWHEDIKPHEIDVEEVLDLCFTAWNLIQGNMSLQGEEDSEPADYPLLEALQYQLAEQELRKLFLRLAIIIRTPDDVMRQVYEPDDYMKHKGLIEAKLGIGDFHFDDITECTPLDIREVSNKIIHALDFRPTYSTADGSREGKWGMSGMIKLQGVQRGKDWGATIYPHGYLEAILELVGYKPPDLP